MDVNHAKEEVILAGNELVRRGLVARTWGNVSCRIDSERFAITPSGISYDRLTPHEIVVVHTRTLEYEGSIKPSSEKGIHAAAYLLDPEIRFVIHTHQTYATCLSVAGYSALTLSGDEAVLLKGGVGLADYALPGTKALKRHVADVLQQGRPAVLMEKHGALITGPSRESAFSRAVALEAACMRVAAGLPLLSGNAPDMACRKRPDGSAEITSPPPGGQEAPLPMEALQALHTAIYQKYATYHHCLLLRSPAVEAAMQQTDVMPALLDDFAQMVGGDLRKTAGDIYAGEQAREKAIASAVRNLRGRNAVYISGLGLLCCAGEPADCEALLILAEKNALAYLNAARAKRISPISLLDRKLMRLVYTKTYAKKK